jgi:hypothetical protein
MMARVRRAGPVKARVRTGAEDYYSEWRVWDRENKRNTTGRDQEAGHGLLCLEGDYLLDWASLKRLATAGQLTTFHQASR